MKLEKPQEPEGAPAYFVQYAALWCIMLAFFVVLLTLGHDRTDAYKTGIGYIRDAFGLKGGLGMLDFWRKATEGQGDAKPTTAKPPEDGDLIGHFRGMLWKEGLSSISILRTEFDDLGVRITVDTPIEFAPDDAVLNRRTQDFLNRIGTVIYNLPDCIVAVNSYAHGRGSDEQDLLLAAERSTAIARYLQGPCRIPPRRVESLAYSHERYLAPLGESQTNQAVQLAIRKIKKGRAPL